MSEVAIAFGLTVFAGLGTGVGAAIAFFAHRANYRFLSISTGFSAGVMLYVSFVEIFYKGEEALAEVYGETWASWVNVAAFFGGMLLIGLIDSLVPSAENPHETHPERERAPLHDPSAPVPEFTCPGFVPRAPAVADGHDHHHRQGRLLRMGLLTALAIGIHNFPEGLATFLAALRDPGLGAAIAVAIALHNIPEGISVSVPIYYATGNRRRAFAFSLASGLAEPVGAGLAYLVLVLLTPGTGAAVPPQLMGILFAGVAGIMVYISLDQLLPTSRAYGRGHDSQIGLVAGMVVMALSLLLMK